MTLATVVFVTGVIGQAYLALRWFGDPYEAVARDAMRGLASPTRAMLRVGAGFGIHGSALFAGGWYARLPWVWWLYGGLGLAGGVFMTALAIGVRLPQVRDHIEERPGWKEARGRVLTGADVRLIPKLRNRAENRRGHAPFAAAILGLWIWCWWPVLPSLGG